MKQFFLTLIISFCFLSLNAQSIHTVYIDSTHTSASYYDYNDTTINIQYGDSLIIISKISEDTKYAFWVNDNDSYFNPPTFTTITTIPENDTVIRLKFLNDTLCEYWTDNWSFAGVIFHYQIDSLMTYSSLGDLVRQIFFTYPNINSTNENDDFLPDPIVIYPSPARDIINIKGISYESASFSIFDLSGNLIKSGRISLDRKIDIQKLPQGTYLLHLSTRNSIKVLKFVKI